MHLARLIMAESKIEYEIKLLIITKTIALPESAMQCLKIIALM